MEIIFATCEMFVKMPFPCSTLHDEFITLVDSLLPPSPK